ncbi:hypothetical protein MKW98_008639, partial [Papaver atlanticum]
YDDDNNSLPIGASSFQCPKEIQDFNRFISRIWYYEVAVCLINLHNIIQIPKNKDATSHATSDKFLTSSFRKRPKVFQNKNLLGPAEQESGI